MAAGSTPTADVKTADYYHGMGYQLRREGDYRGAINYYTLALESSPQHFKALFNRGFAFDKLGEFSAAIRDYSSSLELELPNRGTAKSSLMLFRKALEAPWPT